MSDRRASEIPWFILEKNTALEKVRDTFFMFGPKCLTSYMSLSRQILPFAMSPNGAATMRLSCPKIARGLAAYLMYVLAIISSHLLAYLCDCICIHACVCIHDMYIYMRMFFRMFILATPQTRKVHETSRTCLIHLESIT